MYKVLSTIKPEAQVGKKFDDNDIALLSSVAKLDKEGKATLKSNGFTEQDWANFQEGLLPPTTNQKKQAVEVLGKINKMLSEDQVDALTDAVGTLKTPDWIGGTKRKDFEALFSNLKDSLAMTNLDKLKGAMSDKDIEFLRNTAAAISLDNSEDFFMEQLKELKKKYEDKITSQGGAVTSESINAPTNTQST